jgi:CheY-like chemotaxis protein
MRMSDSENERKRELECLRLASDLAQLATETLNPDLKAHCHRMAIMWTDQVEQRPISDISLLSVSIDAMAGSPSKSLPVVLIVEDDPLLRMLAVEVVGEAGYVAIEAGNADEAVALLESRLDISLLFTDVDMPGSIDGLKLAHAVRDRWPPIKIVIVSGKVRLQPTELPSNSCFVRKPYQTAAMVAKLRSLVGSP